VTDQQLEDAARRLVEKSTAEQNLSFHIEDPGTLAWLARMIVEGGEAHAA
jgi:hypothetical protein